MVCFMCKGLLANQLITFMVDAGNCIVIVKNVPAQVCSQCGEALYTDSVTERLETIVNDARKAMSEITIISYPANVA